MTQETRNFIDAIEYAETPEERHQAIIEALQARPELQALMSLIITAEDNGRYELAKPYREGKVC